jgi:hypothetical protein
MYRTDEVTAELGRNATNKFANKSGMRGNMAKPTAIMAMSTMSARGRAATQTLPGPGPIASQWGRLPPDPRAAGAVSLDVGDRQPGRCGVLTRILVGAARDRRSRRRARASATTGPGETTRHGDEAVAPARAGFPSPLKFRGFVTVTPYNGHTWCTLLEDHFVMREFSTVAFALSVAFPALLLHPLQHPCPTRCFFCSDSCRLQASLPQGIIRPARQAGPLSESARGPHPALLAVPGPAGRDRFTPCTMTSTVTAPST